MGLFGSNTKQEPKGYMKNEERLFDGFGGLTKTLIDFFFPFFFFSCYINFRPLCWVY